MKKDYIIELALAALLLLSVLLPIGIFISVSSTLFFALFSLHFAMLLLASILSGKSIFLTIGSVPSLWRAIFGFSLVSISIAALSDAILPVIARDALIHHLAIPKLWIEQGKIFATPWHDWSFYPMLIQLSFTALLQIGPEQLCSFYILLFLPLVVLVTMKICFELTGSSLASVISGIVLILLPIIIKLSGIPLVDLPLTFLCGAGIFFLLVFQGNEKTTAYKAGAAWGLALSCKLNAIPALGLSSLLFFATGLRRATSKIAFSKQFIIFIFIAVLCYSPWLIKNSYWAGNPLYPYANSFFGSSISKESSGLMGLNALQQRVMLYGESLPEVALLPIRIFFGGEDGNPRRFDGLLSPLLLVGLLFGLFQLKDPKYRQLSLLSLAFIFFSLLSTGARVRYLTPIIVALCALTGAALFRVSLSIRFRKLAPLLILSQLLFSCFYILNNYPINASLSYLRGANSKDQLLERFIPEYALIKFCNNNLPKSSKLFLIYTGNQFYLYDLPTISSGHSSAEQLLSWLKRSQNMEQLLTQIKAQGVTNFVIHEERLITVLSSALDTSQKKLWNDFFNNHLSPIYSNNGFSLYQLR